MSVRGGYATVQDAAVLALADSRFSKSDVLVYLAVLRGEQLHQPPSARDLQRRLDLAYSTTRDALDRLVTAGLLVRRRHGRSSSYEGVELTPCHLWSHSAKPGGTRLTPTNSADAPALTPTNSADAPAPNSAGRSAPFPYTRVTKELEEEEDRALPRAKGETEGGLIVRYAALIDAADVDGLTCRIWTRRPCKPLSGALKQAGWRWIRADEVWEADSTQRRRRIVAAVVAAKADLASAAPPPAGVSSRSSRHSARHATRGRDFADLVAGTNLNEPSAAGCVPVRVHENANSAEWVRFRTAGMATLGPKTWEQVFGLFGGVVANGLFRLSTYDEMQALVVQKSYAGIAAQLARDVFGEHVRVEVVLEAQSGEAA